MMMQFSSKSFSLLLATTALSSFASALKDGEPILDWENTYGDCYKNRQCTDDLEFPHQVNLKTCFCSGGSFAVAVPWGKTDIEFCTNWEVKLQAEPQASALNTIGGGGGGITPDTVTMVEFDMEEIVPPSGNERLRQRKLQESASFELEFTDYCGGGSSGDPHVKKWNSEWYDFHGECDLVMLSASNFGQGKGLDLHIRTKARNDYSFIESAALMIGGDILEVSSHGMYKVNGVDSADLGPATLSGYSIHHSDKTRADHRYTVDLGEGNSIVMSTIKDFVNIKFQSRANQKGDSMVAAFGDSTGLMGSFQHGEQLARDGQTILEDANEFGQEWQVLDSEPKLFENMERYPQFPQKCVMPTPISISGDRRLAESAVSRDDAEKACEGWGEDMERCIFDVMTTGDMELAVAGGY